MPHRTRRGIERLRFQLRFKSQKVAQLNCFGFSVLCSLNGALLNVAAPCSLKGASSSTVKFWEHAVHSFRTACNYAPTEPLHFISALPNVDQPWLSLVQFKLSELSNIKTKWSPYFTHVTLCNTVNVHFVKNSESQLFVVFHCQLSRQIYPFNQCLYNTWWSRLGNGLHN